MTFVDNTGTVVSQPGPPERSPWKTAVKFGVPELLGVLGALVLPLVAAHFVFYSELGISPSDVGLDFGDLVQRSTPGLLGMLGIVTVLVVGAYSVVVWVNLLLVPFVVSRVSRIARRVSLGSLGLCLVLVWIPPMQSMAAWVLPVWLLLMTVLGLVAVVPGHSREMALGLLIGAPAYVLLQIVALLLVLPILNGLSETSPPGDPPRMSLLLLVPVLAFVAIGYAILLLPTALVIATDQERQGWGWKHFRAIRQRLSVRASAVAFAVFVLVATHTTIVALAVWNAEAIKSGYDPGVFGSTVLDEAVQHTYGLPVSCVAVTQLKPFGARLPDTAIRLGSRNESEFALVWSETGAVLVPSDVARLSPIRRAACVTSP